MARSRTSNGTNGWTAHLGFGAKLPVRKDLAADKLRSNRDAAVPSAATSEPQAKAYKHAPQSNAATRRLAVMNLALRGIEADFGPEHADTFRSDLHPDLRADYVLADPPLNDSDRFRQDDDVRCTEQQRRWSNRRLTRRAPPCSGVKFGVLPRGNANFAWVQHFIHHLAPHGMAGFVLANGSMSSNQSGEGDIRRAIIEADLGDCRVALPGQLFHIKPIPVCLWFCGKNKALDSANDAHLFDGETEFSLVA